jgi:hypothetical protein
MSLWDDADGSAARGESQSQTLVFEGFRLKWMPCTGSGELAIISGIIEENLPYRKASDLDPSSLSFPDCGWYRNAAKKIPSEWGRDQNIVARAIFSIFPVGAFVQVRKKVA